MPSNLPPGVTDGMLPGNRAEDMEWESFCEWLADETDHLSLTVEEAKRVWELGVMMLKPIDKIVAIEVAKALKWERESRQRIEREG